MVTTSSHNTGQESLSLDEATKPRRVITAQHHAEPKQPTEPFVRPIHMIKTIGMAIGLTILFMIPQFMIHIPTGIIAPISAGITTGGVMRPTEVESFIIGLTLFAVIALPVPILYHTIGLFDHLPFIAIAVFSGVFGAYYGTFIGVFSWIGTKFKKT